MKKPSTKGYQPRFCPMPKCEFKSMKVEQLFAHMKEVHQGKLFPDKV